MRRERHDPGGENTVPQDGPARRLRIIPGRAGLGNSGSSFTEHQAVALSEFIRSNIKHSLFHRMPLPIAEQYCADLATY